MLLFVYTTTRKRFVIFTCRYFKLSWNTTALSQSSCSNFSCSSIIAEIPNSQYCSDICFLWTIDLCRINVWGYTEIWPFWKKGFKSCKIGTTSVYTNQKTNQQAHSFLICKVICMWSTRYYRPIRDVFFFGFFQWLVILGADQKDRSLWERDWHNWHMVRAKFWMNSILFATVPFTLAE